MFKFEEGNKEGDEADVAAPVAVGLLPKRLAVLEPVCPMPPNGFDEAGVAVGACVVVLVPNVAPNDGALWSWGLLTFPNIPELPATGAPDGGGPAGVVDRLPNSAPGLLGAGVVLPT